MFADIAAAGKADFADLGIGTDCVANDAARTCDALNGFLRQARVDKNLGQFECRKWGVAGGFEDDRIAGREGWAHFVADEIEREVKGRNGGHHATGNPQRKAEFARPVRGSAQVERFASQALGFLGRQDDGLLGTGCLAHALGEDLALFEGNGAPQVVEPLYH